ncbi:hypothetical protein [Hyalangium sp.]|uniref:hypothetical protein n=1 Tax=Hyalangium sp. TaxID=2028555 RepID=UPI002D281C16|nr:hypothetical protein [Hyalangium sp.]HYI01904.1 hypothetical protein [Hyalangium sp.]
MAAVIAPASLLQVEPRLRALILRMLSVRPEERGTAEHLAEALEQAAEHTLSSGPPARVSATALARPWRTWTWPLAAAASLALAVGMGWVASGGPEETSPFVHWAPARAEEPDAGPTGLGEALASASGKSSRELPTQQRLEEDTPPEPLPGQDVQEAKGRCPRKQQVALNGGCWAEAPFAREECEEKGGYVFKKKCYLAPIPRGRRPTSSPANPDPAATPH